MKRLYLIQEFLSSLMLILLILIIQVFYFEKFMHGILISFQFLLAVIIAFAFWVLKIFLFNKLWSQIQKEELIKETDRLQLEESKKLIQMLQSYRHDFRNQLQVIKVMAQFNKTEEIVKYIQDCSTALDLSSNVVAQITNPVISATLLVFATKAREKGINFQADSDVDFSRFNISAVQTSRILANILQNALESLEATVAEERAIQVTIWESPDNYTFLIWNNGPIIPESLLGKIFQSGFSTKQSTGLGLAIVKELAGEIGAQIAAKSTEGLGTEFRITIPKLPKELKHVSSVTPVHSLPGTPTVHDSSN